MQGDYGLAHGSHGSQGLQSHLAAAQALQELHAGGRVGLDEAVLQQLAESTRMANEAAAVKRAFLETALKARADVLVALINQHPDWSPEQLKRAVDLLLPYTV
jgi:hypothetical protein